MRHYLYLSILLLISCSASKEIKNSNTSFLNELLTLEHVNKIEEKKNSLEVKRSYWIALSNQYFPGVKNFDFAEPKIYERKKRNLKTVVSYFYTQNDSIVRLIEYSWDDLDSSDSLKNIYSKNELSMNKYFQKKGTPIINKDSTYWQEELYWENDKIFVFQFIFGDKLKNAHRTRLIVRQK